MKKKTILAEDYAGSAETREDLDRRYREIGISAVAAALRYQGEVKTEPPTPEDRDKADKAA